jgi:APA family basic amino acid/polyamine antiporter
MSRFISPSGSSIVLYFACFQAKELDMQSESSSSPSSSLYVRQSSGLVREASVIDAMIFNAVFSAPVGATLAFGIFYALGAFPGADLIQALLIAFVVNIPVVVMMSMMASTMPRTGGDYVWISRILHPSVAVFSNFAAAISALIGAAFWARSFAVLALGPALAVLGAVTQNTTLINAGNAVSGSDATGQWWTFGLGLLLIIILAVAMSAGTKTSFRVQNVCWIIATLGTFLAFFALLISSNQTFIANFNAFAQPFTHSSNSFQAIQDAAAKTGFVFLGGHQFSSTLPVVAIIMTFMMWNWWSVYIAGELKSAGNLRRQLVIMIGALVWDTLFMIIGVSLLYHSATEQFIASINALAGTPGYPLPVAPFYNLMASIAANNSIFALLIAISFLFWNLPAMFPNTFMPVRTIFAWSFDRILPSRLSDVSERTHAPIPAIIVASLIVAGILAWSVLSSSFATLLSMGVLAGIITILCVSIAAIVFPLRRPDLYRNAPASTRIVGIPLLPIVAVLSIAVMIGLAYLVLTYQQLGIATPQLGPLPGFIFMGSLIIIGLAIFFIARFVRSRRGINLDLIYKELPPE